MTNKFIFEGEEMFRKSELNCAEAVLYIVLSCRGVPNTEIQNVLKSATGFGGGLNSGLTCGALTGAVMATGYQFGRNLENGQDPYIARQNATELVACFKEHFGETNCEPLSKHLARGSKEQKTHCGRFVTLMVDKSLELVSENELSHGSNDCGAN